MVHTVMRKKGPQQSNATYRVLFPHRPRSMSVVSMGATEFQLSHTAVCVQAKPLRTCDKSIVTKTSLTFTW